MKFFKFLKQYLEPVSFFFLIVIIEMVLMGAMLLGWVLLKDSNIVISIVGAIIFLISSGYFVVSLLALIIAIFTNIYHR